MGRGIKVRVREVRSGRFSKDQRPGVSIQNPSLRSLPNPCFHVDRGFRLVGVAEPTGKDNPYQRKTYFVSGWSKNTKDREPL